MSGAESSAAGEAVKDAFREYFGLNDEVRAHEAEIEKLKARQDAILRVIHEFMRAQDLDEINVNHVRFSRVVKGPRKARKVDDKILQNVLRKHLGGEDGRLRGVLEDLARIREEAAAGADGGGTTREVLVRRTLKKQSEPQE